MKCLLLLSAAGILMTAAACSDPVSNPAAPTSGLLSATSEAKPGAGVPHTLTFTDYLVGSGSVTGTITGAYTSGNLKASASGTYTLSVTTVDRGNPTFCTDQDLDIVRAALGGPANLVESKTGSLSVSVSQASAVDGRSSLVWQFANISGSDGRTWSMSGNSTTNFPAYVDSGSNITSLSVSQTNGVIGFSRLNAAGRKQDFSTGCRANFTLTMTQ